MICYKDKTFCNSDCTNKECHRFLSEEENDKALVWTQSFKPRALYPLLSLSDFSSTCTDYKIGETND